MPLFGSKKNKNTDMLEVVDFSNDTWSYKGEAPVYQIQSDGFSYDVVDADGNDKNAISLGLSGMLVIVLNAKSPKIKEEEILPHFGKVIKTRNWHSMTVKEANFLVQTAIKKLTSSAMSGDVFDLASYAPLEVKRVLLKTLFTISRTQMKPEFREESEHRIIDDIVPEIFAHPEYELALLTGLIVKPDAHPAETVSRRIETAPVLDPISRYANPPEQEPLVTASAPSEEPDSAFAELQKIYGRKSDPVQVSPAVQQPSEYSAAQTPMEPKSAPAEPVSVRQAPASAPQPENPFAQKEPKSAPSIPAPNFSAPQPNNPFAKQESVVPQPSMPAFSGPQPGNPFTQAGPSNIPQPGMPNFAVPQPPMPNFGMQQPNPYGNVNQQGGAPMQNPGYAPNNYPGNMPMYPGQMWQQNPQNMQGPNMQQPYQGQMRGQTPQAPQNMGGYPQGSGITQNSEGQNAAFYPGWMNRPPMTQQPPQNNQSSENA